MITVYKYPLPNIENTLLLPEGADVLRVAQQRNRIHLWAKVDTGRPERMRTFCVFGTGYEIWKHFDWKYVGSCEVDGGDAFHVFERLADELKPCPFCGGVAQSTESDGLCTVRCSNRDCGVVLRTLLQDDAASAARVWNTRL